MPETPYDQSLALAAQVSTMRDHFLEVSCGCGESRILSLAVMAKERRIATATLAHIALRITCHGCMTGPDDIYARRAEAVRRQSLGAGWSGRCR